MGTYLVLGTVIARSLPLHEVRVGRATIFPGRGDDVMKEPTITAPSAAETEMLSAAPFDIQVKSRWAIGFWDVHAENDDEALTVTRSKLLPPVRTALELATNGPVYVQITQATTETNSTAYSGVATTAPMMVAEMEPDQLARWRKLTEVIATDPTATTAVRAICQAHDRSLSAGADPSLNASMLLDYIRGVEAIVGGVQSDSTDNATFMAAATPLVNQLEKKLKTLTSPKKRLQAVRNANAALRRLAVTDSRDRTQAAGELLGIEQSIINEAKRLWDLRNRKGIGHPGDLPPNIQADAHRAAQVANIFLDAYVSRIADSA